MLEAAAADVEFDGGRFTVSGTDHGIDISEVAKFSYTRFGYPPELEAGLNERAVYRPASATFPNGCHVCEIEIDGDTGVVEIVDYTVVDDVGTMINPLIVEGQIHGGIAQGAGQILGEAVIYAPDDGQLLSGSFMDYPMPRADDFPPIVVAMNPVPSTNNPMGIKGCGEAGTIGALPAVMNAIVDALSPLGISAIDMPATPERIWRAMRDHEAKKAE